MKAYLVLQLVETLVAFVWVWSTPGHGFALDGVYKPQSGLGVFGPIAALFGTQFMISFYFVSLLGVN